MNGSIVYIRDGNGKAGTENKVAISDGLPVLEKVTRNGCLSRIGLVAFAQFRDWSPLQNCSREGDHNWSPLQNWSGRLFLVLEKVEKVTITRRLWSVRLFPVPKKVTRTGRLPPSFPSSKECDQNWSPASQELLWSLLSVPEKATRTGLLSRIVLVAFSRTDRLLQNWSLLLVAFF
nr:hypothetical protein Iba_chr10dCG10530 [Ipomoea batatas]